MGARSLILAGALAACGPKADPMVPAPATIHQKVARDFEQAVKTSKDAYVSLFDFVAVGQYEILIHRYDLNGRFPNLPDDVRARFEAEDGTPYPPERERRNVGNFYTILAQRTVGTGGCTGAAPMTEYGRQLGEEFEPLPEGTPPGYETLRTAANGYLAKGGVVGIRCSGGKGGLAVVYTERPNARGYELITIYDDSE
ncbi:MAG TPA: hypothetical protein VMZ53_19105 [Kofleriaceae bacterium]|nr:hypothetical protein [Kofleriaceae bacterium]